MTSCLQINVRHDETLAHIISESSAAKEYLAGRYIQTTQCFCDRALVFIKQ